MEQALAGLLLFSIPIGLLVLMRVGGPKEPSSDEEVVVVKCSKCGAPYLRIEISKHC